MTVLPAKVGRFAIAPVEAAAVSPTASASPHTGPVAAHAEDGRAELLGGVPEDRQA